MKDMLLIGPFSQILTMNHLRERGPLKDEELEVIEKGGILCLDGKIIGVGPFDELKAMNALSQNQIHLIEEEAVLLPGFIDSHTHICYGGNRAGDFAARNNGKSYQEIAAAGGGIWSTVKHTRKASESELLSSLLERGRSLISGGVTTAEVKSGYGLSIESELKMLRSINDFNRKSKLDIIPTCLAAHIIPRDFEAGEAAYLDHILEDLVPIILKEKLCNRFDIFVEENAYTYEPSKRYLSALSDLGFYITVHGDQFTTGGSKLAVEVGAVSVDHLEVSTDKEIQMLAKSKTVPVALPGASIGLGCSFTPARKLLDAGCSLVIASDWNPGSAPMGELLTQASILSTYEKLSAAEVFSAVTFRAANVLQLENLGKIAKGYQGDFVAYPTNNFREILYQQGRLKPSKVWKKGIEIYSS